MSNLRVDELESLATGRTVTVDDIDTKTREDLANPDKGAAIVARGVVAVDSIADLLALPEGQRKEGLRYLVKGYHAGSDIGGGEFYWDAASTKAGNGGTVFDVSGVAAGRWIRVEEVYPKAEHFGGDINSATALYSEQVSTRAVRTPIPIQMPTEFNLLETVNPTYPLAYTGGGGATVNVSNTLTGPAFNLGVTQYAPDQFSRDYHKYSGMFFTGGDAIDYGINVKLWAANQPLFEDLTFIGFGNSSAWCLNFEGQNWWPIIDKFSLSDMGEKVNGIKLIDDGDGGSQQGAGNSRAVIDKARIRYLHGRNADTTGIAVSATSSVTHASAIENAGKGIQFCYPSASAKLQNVYFEQAGGTAGTASIVIGDNTAKPNNYIFNLSIKDVYSNLHSGNGKFIRMGNASTTFGDLIVDNVSVALPGNEPVITPNDIAGQSMYIGYVSAPGSSVLPSTPQANPTHVRDTYNREWSVLNGNGYSSKLVGSSAVLPQNMGTPIADMWRYIGDISATYVRKTYSGAERKRLRGASTGVRIESPLTGTYAAVSYYIPDVAEHAGLQSTVQFLSRVSGGAAKSITVKLRLSNGTTQDLTTASRTINADWTEVSVPFFFPDTPNLDDDAFIIVEISGDAVKTFAEYTGVRVYEGNCGLSTSCVESPTSQYVGVNPWIYSKKVTIPANSATFTQGFDFELRSFAGNTISGLLIIDGTGAVLTGTVAANKRSVTWNTSSLGADVTTAEVRVRPT